ncbi:uncharacterized protein CLUP02_11251 [Colletotrichum lupini]|uniref:Uncharacterized protein n=1 Tax=Colletotrichum lupini TaxID=145971 RepID=A0A9Q8SYB1_9PEZI|nr:uncharacterized protein CLUP02_11251 [Colletotrichum lupini]UQC85752.1 hypothetical protein CLUP02_11251 [Colletotrichum lupini]
MSSQWIHQELKILSFLRGNMGKLHGKVQVPHLICWLGLCEASHWLHPQMKGSIYLGPLFATARQIIAMDRTDHPHSNPRLRIEYGSKAGLAAFYTGRNDLIFADICSILQWGREFGIRILQFLCLIPGCCIPTQKVQNLIFGMKPSSWPAFGPDVGTRRTKQLHPRQVAENASSRLPLSSMVKMRHCIIIFLIRRIPKYRTSSNITALEGSNVSSSSTVFCAVILDGVALPKQPRYIDVYWTNRAEESLTYTTNICSDSAGIQILLSLGPPGALPSSYAMPRLKCLAAAAANDASLRVAVISNPISLRHLDPSSSLQRRLRLNPHLALWNRSNQRHA